MPEKWSCYRPRRSSALGWGYNIAHRQSRGNDFVTFLPAVVHKSGCPYCCLIVWHNKVPLSHNCESTKLLLFFMLVRKMIGPLWCMVVSRATEDHFTRSCCTSFVRKLPWELQSATNTSNMHVSIIQAGFDPRNTVAHIRGFPCIQLSMILLSRHLEWERRELLKHDGEVWIEDAGLQAVLPYTGTTHFILENLIPELSSRFIQTHLLDYLLNACMLAQMWQRQQFDALGWFAPTIVKMKILLQQIWETSKLAWSTLLQKAEHSPCSDCWPQEFRLRRNLPWANKSCRLLWSLMAPSTESDPVVGHSVSTSDRWHTWTQVLAPFQFTKLAKLVTEMWTIYTSFSSKDPLSCLDNHKRH